MAKSEATVEELVAMIQRGELRLPEMQRRYVWRAPRIRDLVDSIYRGYPSGAILVWDTDEEVPLQDFAVPQEANPYASTRLLLDGQQRLATPGESLGDDVVDAGSGRPADLLLEDARHIFQGSLVGRVIDVGVADVAGEQRPRLARNLPGDLERDGVHRLEILLATDDAQFLAVNVVGERLDDIGAGMDEVEVQALNVECEEATLRIDLDYLVRRTGKTLKETFPRGAAP